MDNTWNLPNEDTFTIGENLWERMLEPEIQVAITGAGRCMATNLIYLIAQGDVFGKNQPVSLRLVDVQEQLMAVEACAMEMVGAGFPLLKDYSVTHKLEEAFKGIDAAFLLPYPALTTQQNHKEWLEERLALAKLHGEALNMYAKPKVKVVMVGHCANTRVLICSRFAPAIPINNFTAVSRHIQNYATSLLSLKLRVRADHIEDIIVWGNTSETVYADLRHATVKLPSEEKEINAYAAVKNDYWIKGEYSNAVQEMMYDATENLRSIATAVATADHMREWWCGTRRKHITSMVVVSDGSYQVPKGLFFSFPVAVKNGKWRILKGLHISAFDQIKLNENVEQLKQECAEAMKICQQYWQFPDVVSEKNP